MIVQILYATLIIQEFDSLVIISLILSFISSITVILSWCLSICQNQQFILEQYVLKVVLISSQDDQSQIQSHIQRQGTDLDLQAELANISKYRRLKRTLRKSLALSLGINSSKLEIGYIDITNDGCNIHIIHFIAHNKQTAKAFLSNLYSGKYERIGYEIQRIFHLNMECVVRLRLSKEQEIEELQPELNKFASALVSEMLVVLEDQKLGHVGHQKSADLLEMALRSHIVQHHIVDEFESHARSRASNFSVHNPAGIMSEDPSMMSRLTVVASNPSEMEIGGVIV